MFYVLQVDLRIDHLKVGFLASLVVSLVTSSLCLVFVKCFMGVEMVVLKRSRQYKTKLEFLGNGK